MTYAELRQALEDWLDKPELAGSSPLFLNFAHLRLNRELSVWEMEKTANIIAATGEELNNLQLDFLNNTAAVTLAEGWEMVPGALVLPSDFGRIRQVSIANAGIFESAPLGELINRLAQGKVSQRVFALDAGRLAMWPLPGAGTTVKLDYYLNVPQLSDSLQTNIFTENYSDLLLWAALIEACNFLGDDVRAQVFERKYVTTLQVSNEKLKQVKFGSTPLRRRIA